MAYRDILYRRITSAANGDWQPSIAEDDARDPERTSASCAPATSRDRPPIEGGLAAVQ